MNAWGNTPFRLICFNALMCPMPPLCDSYPIGSSAIWRTTEKKWKNAMTKKKNLKRARRCMSELSQEMLTLAKAGKSGVDILSELDISVQQARKIHYDLIVSGKIPARTLYFPSGRRNYATEKGIFIPRGRLDALGLSAMFPDGQSVKLAATEAGLVIAPDVTAPRRASVSPRAATFLHRALGWSGRTDNVIALGAADEPNA